MAKDESDESTIDAFPDPYRSNTVTLPDPEICKHLGYFSFGLYQIKLKKALKDAGIDFK